MGKFMKMKIILLPLTIAASALLAACGGGGSGDNVNSSYSKTIVKGGVTYECKSENAAKLCENGNCTSCESSLDKVITAACSSSVNAGQTLYAVTNAGCVASMKNSNKITGYCAAGTLKLLAGSGYTLNKVSINGSAYPSGEFNSSITSETLRCSNS
jgi:hypothetical protein